MRNILLLVFSIALIWWLASHFTLVLGVLQTILSILSPLLVGLVLAFVLNLLMNPLERLWLRLFPKEGRLSGRLRRPVCLLLSFVIVLGTLFALCFVVIPRLGSTVADMVATITAYFKTLDIRYDQLRTTMAQYAITLPELDLSDNSLVTKLTSLLAKGGSALLSATTSVFSAVANLLMGIVFSIYILAQKETLSRQVKMVLYALFPEQRVTPLLAFLGRVNRTFSQFVTGQTIEAIILGTLVCIGMLIFRMPYAPVIAMLVGVTALIPILGSWIGAIIGVLLILPTSFMDAVWFVVFLIVLQQIEGNLIYPHVVGKSVGLPGIWVFFAVIVGGGLGGVAGMLLGVPVCAVIYDELRRLIRRRKTAVPDDTPPESP